MLSYSTTPIVLLTILAIALTLFLFKRYIQKFIYFIRNIPNLLKKKAPEQPVYVAPNLYAIKQKYLQALTSISADLEAGRITNREAYQRISRCHRTFIGDINYIQAQNMTLGELKYLNKSELMPLVSMMEKYYQYEFAPSFQSSTEQVLDTINNTKRDIETWNIRTY